MKFSILLVISLFAGSLFANTLECQSTSPTGQVVTSEGRLIFVSRTALVEISPEALRVTLEQPSNGVYELAITKSTGHSLEAKHSGRVYPSGNMVRSYLTVQSIKLSQLDTDSPKLVVKRVDKKRFKEELRYLGEYSCVRK